MDRSRVPVVLNVILGFWLLISPFALSYEGARGALWSDVVVGLLVMGLAISRLRGTGMWVSLATILLGAWTLVSPVTLMYHPNYPATVNNIVLGCVIGAVALWTAFVIPDTEEWIRVMSPTVPTSPEEARLLDRQDDWPRPQVRNNRPTEPTTKA